jgi:hypothetical protein
VDDELDSALDGMPTEARVAPRRSIPPAGAEAFEGSQLQTSFEPMSVLARGRVSAISRWLVVRQDRAEMLNTEGRPSDVD